MLRVFPMILVPLLTEAETTLPTVLQEGSKPQLDISRNPEEWISDGILDVADNTLPVTRSYFEAREKKKKKKKKHKLNRYIIPLIVGFMLIKSILLPIALKTLSILSGKAVVLSLMSLILAAIVGLKKVAQSHSSGGYEVGKYKRHDFYDMTDDFLDSEPYKFYRERRRRK